MGSGYSIRLVIAADIRLYREGLEIVLSDVDGVEVIGTASRSAHVVPHLAHLQPDVLLIDLAMPDALRTIREAGPQHIGFKVVAITVPDAETEIIRCAEAGVASYVTRDGSVENLVQAIRDAHAGELHCSPRLAGTLLRRLSELGDPSIDSNRIESLTAREMEVLQLIEHGCSNKDIAKQFHIGLPTVKNHVHNLLSKLGVRTRAEAAALTRGRPRLPAHR